MGQSVGEAVEVGDVDEGAVNIDALRADEGSSGDGVEDGGVGVLVGLWGDVVHYVVLQDIQVVAKRIKFVFQRDCYAIYNLLNHFSTSFSFA